MTPEEKKTLQSIEALLPYRNTNKSMRAALTTRNIETAEVLPAIVEQNPVLLGWANNLLGVMRLQSKVDMINSGTGARIVTYTAPANVSFAVLGCMIDFSGDDQIPTTPVQIVFTGISNGNVVFETRFSGTISNIKDPSSKGGHRAIVALLPTAPQTTYDLVGPNPPKANARFVIPAIELTADDIESADTTKAEVITVDIQGIAPTFFSNVQLLTPGNPNYDEMVLRLMEDDLLNAQLDAPEGSSSTILNF